MLYEGQQMQKFRLNGLIVSGLLLASAGHANVVGRGDLSFLGEDDSGGKAYTSVETKGETNPVGKEEVCNNSTDERYLPLGLLKRAILFPSKIKISSDKNGNAKVKLPRYVNACLDLKLETQRIGNDVFIRFKNKYKYTTADLSTKEMADNESDKYYNCLKNKGLLTPAGALNYEKANKNGLISYRLEIPFKVNIRKKDESHFVYFGSSVISDYGIGHKASASKVPSNWKCMAYENIHGSDPLELYTSTEDREYKRIVKICQNGKDYDEILKELSRLDKSSLGNAKLLKSILGEALDKLHAENGQKAYARLMEIEKEFKYKKGELNSEEESERLADEYVDNLKEYNKYVIRPAIKELDGLMKLRGSKNSAKFDKKIKALNEAIGKYEKGSSKRQAMMLDHFKEYNLGDQARAVKGVLLTSQYYSQVYKGRRDKRGKQYTIAQADKQIRKTLATFEDTHLRDWQNDYDSRNGSKKAVYTARREMQRRKRKMDYDYQAYQQKESKYQMKYCGKTFFGTVKNPMACKRFTNGKSRRQKAFLSRRKKSLLAYRGASERHNRYSRNFERYREELMQDREENDYYYDNFAINGGAYMGDDSDGFWDDYSYGQNGGPYNYQYDAGSWGNQYSMGYGPGIQGPTGNFQANGNYPPTGNYRQPSYIMPQPGRSQGLPY